MRSFSFCKLFLSPAVINTTVSTIDLDCGIDDGDGQENYDDVGNDGDDDHHHTSGLSGQSSL